MDTTRSKPARLLSGPAASSRLHRDVLHGLFVFVEWRELLGCAQVCRDWLAVAASVRPSRAVTVAVTSGAQARRLLRWPLRVQVAELQDGTQLDQLLDESASLWPLLPALPGALPQLQRLHVWLPYALLPRLPLAFHPRLQSLELQIAVGQDDVSSVGTTMEEFAERLAAATPSELRSLSLHANCDGRIAVPTAVLTALSSLGSLTELRVDALWGDPAVCAAYRSMLQLRSLARVPKSPQYPLPHTCYWDPDSLEQLTEGELGVNYPRLESLCKVGILDDEMLPLLLRLPSLTELKPSYLELYDVRPLLTGLPQLRTLHVEPGYLADLSAWWSGFAAALLLRPELTALTLSCSHHALTDVHLAAIVSALPQLQSLTVERARLKSLGCFADTPHLAQSLQYLRLGCFNEAIAPAELVHLQPLRALRHLIVICLSETVPADLRAQMTPGNAQFAARYWPRLSIVELDTNQ